MGSLARFEVGLCFVLKLQERGEPVCVRLDVVLLPVQESLGGWTLWLPAAGLQPLFRGRV